MVPCSISDVVLSINAATQVVVENGVITIAGDNPVEDVASSGSPTKDPQEGPKWYAITVGREPGIFSGPCVYFPDYILL